MCSAKVNSFLDASRRRVEGVHVLVFCQMRAFACGADAGNMLAPRCPLGFRVDDFFLLFLDSQGVDRMNVGRS